MKIRAPKNKCAERGIELIQVGQLNKRHLRHVDRQSVIDDISRIAQDVARMGLDTLQGCRKPIR